MHVFAAVFELPFSQVDHQHLRCLQNDASERWVQRWVHLRGPPVVQRVGPVEAIVPHHQQGVSSSVDAAADGSKRLAEGDGDSERSADRGGSVQQAAQAHSLLACCGVAGEGNYALPHAISERRYRLNKLQRIESVRPIRFDRSRTQPP